MEPKFFKNTQELRDWLKKNHAIETMLWLGYYKKHSSKYNFSWSESVDELLCFGWIDGLRKSIDDERYMIRITPRKPKSNWSKVNLDKIEVLLKSKKIHNAGLKAFSFYTPPKTNQYSFEQKDISLTSDYLKQLKSDKDAWRFFNNSAPSTKKQSIWWVMNAKQEVTRQRRLNQLIDCSKKQEKIPHLVWKKKKS